MPRKTEYPLDVHRFYDEVWSKGHHDFLAFAEAVYEEELGNPKDYTLRHRWARTVPFPGERESSLVYCDGPGRGAFPVTEAEVYPDAPKD
jgi:hypothetical protein